MATTYKGWIKMFRSLQDNILWQEKPFSRGQAWVDLLLSVNHKDNVILIDGRPKKIKSGQFWTSRDKLAKRWGWSKSKVNRFLILLTDTHMVSVSGTPSGTLLTVINYSNFTIQGNANVTSNVTPTVRPGVTSTVTSTVHKQ